LPDEVILVDDCSTDGTFILLSGLQLAFPSLTLVVLRNESNAGAAFSRNRAMQVAKGRYLAFLDADDSWHRDKLQLQVQWLNEHPDVTLLAHRCVVEGEEVAKNSYSSSEFDASCRLFSYSDLMLRNRFSTPSVVMRSNKKFVFDHSLRYAEDFDLWLRVAKSAGCVHYSTLPLATLFKPRYGANGLSANLLGMQSGLMDVYRKQYRSGDIGFVRLLAHQLLCSAAFVRRVLLVWFKRFY
jgi:glycosyltransferase involved in cell wall biosynthesis